MSNLIRIEAVNDFVLDYSWVNDPIKVAKNSHSECEKWIKSNTTLYKDLGLSIKITKLHLHVRARTHFPGI